MMEFGLFNLLFLPAGLGLFGFIEPCSIGSSLIFIKYLEGKPAAQKIVETAIFALTRALFIGGLGGGGGSCRCGLHRVSARRLDRARVDVRGNWPSLSVRPVRISDANHRAEARRVKRHARVHWIRPDLRAQYPCLCRSASSGPLGLCQRRGRQRDGACKRVYLARRVRSLPVSAACYCRRVRTGAPVARPVGRPVRQNTVLGGNYPHCLRRMVDLVRPVRRLAGAVLMV